MSDDPYEQFMQLHAPQLRMHAVPEMLWPSVMEQMLAQQFLAGDFLEFSRVCVGTGGSEDNAGAADDTGSEGEAETEGDGGAEVAQTFAIAKRALSPSCATDVFIIDHAVTFDHLDGARNALASYPQLRSRLSQIANSATAVSGATDTSGTADDVDGILLQLEPLVGCYRVGTRDAQTGEVQAQLVFFLPDEVGCYVGRAGSATDNDTDATSGGVDGDGDSASSAQSANLRMAPLVNMASGEAFSVVWPTVEVNEGDVLVCPPLDAVNDGGGSRGDAEAVRDVMLDLHSGTAAQPVPAPAPPAPPTDAVNDSGIDQKTATHSGMATHAKGRLCDVCVLAITPRSGVTPLLVDAEQHTAEKVAMQTSGALKLRYRKLTLEAFDVGAAQNAATAKQCAERIAALTDVRVIFGFACGDLAELLPFVQRIPRINDVLAVLRVLQHDLECCLIPSFEFQQFCFFKTTYMQRLQRAGVPTLPSIFISTLDADERGLSSLPTPSGHNNAEADDHGWTVALGCSALATRQAQCEVGHLDEPLWRDGSDGVGATELTARHWVQATSTCASASGGDGEREGSDAAENAPELVGLAHLAEAVATRFEALEERHWLAPAELELDGGVVFVKSNQMWCREGNRLLKPDTGGQSLREELKETLRFMLHACNASGVQVQPCVAALTGKSPEYRGIFVNGVLRVVAATYFRRPENDGTVLGGEIMVVDHGVPDDDDMMSGVPFRQVRAVMESAMRAIAQLVDETPVMLRTDVAVAGGAAQLVMISEIEGGLDFSVFPSQIASCDVRDAVTDVIAARFIEHVGHPEAHGE